MFPLLLLSGSFLIALLIIRYFTGACDYSLAGRIAMSLMLLIIGIGHFIYTLGMSKMIPQFIPFKIPLVYFTGVLEILSAVGLLFSKFQKTISWLLVIFFIIVLPANIKAAFDHLDVSTGGFSTKGPETLWFRVPLQLFFIGWVYFFGIRSGAKPKP